MSEASSVGKTWDGPAHIRVNSRGEQCNCGYANRTGTPHKNRIGIEQGAPISNKIVSSPVWISSNYGIVSRTWYECTFQPTLQESLSLRLPGQLRCSDLAAGDDCTSADDCPQMHRGSGGVLVIDIRAELRDGQLAAVAVNNGKLLQLAWRGNSSSHLLHPCALCIRE